MDEEKSELSVVQQKVLNGVNYEMLPETSIAVSRSFKKQFFQKNDYTSGNNEAICDWNTGSDFVDTRRSYLTFKCKVNGLPVAGSPTVADKWANFGRGGATNLIKRVVITARSGTELSRTEDYNILAAKLVRYDCDRAYIEQFGDLAGYTDDPAELGLTGGRFNNKTANAAIPAPQDTFPQDEHVFCIPLPMLSGFFAGDGSALLPPQLAAGLRVQLTFADDATVLVSDSPVTYSISEISMVAACTTMVDSWQKQINQEAARDGLTYSFAEWHTSQSNTPSAQTRSNIEVRKAVARAIMALTVTQTSASSLALDNMKSSIYDATNVEYRLGSLYPTQQPVKNSKEMYFIAQSAFNGGILDCKRANAVSPDSFESRGVLADRDGDGITAVSLERNNVSIGDTLNISGLPTNNSRVLAVDITFKSVVAARTNYLFMKHLRVVKAFLNNSVVSE
jgi:hypothetical protein